MEWVASIGRERRGWWLVIFEEMTCSVYYWWVWFTPLALSSLSWAKSKRSCLVVPCNYLVDVPHQLSGMLHRSLLWLTQAKFHTDQFFICLLLADHIAGLTFKYNMKWLAFPFRLILKFLNSGVLSHAWGTPACVCVYTEIQSCFLFAFMISMCRQRVQIIASCFVSRPII